MSFRGPRINRTRIKSRKAEPEKGQDDNTTFRGQRIRMQCKTYETFENIESQLTYRARPDWILLHELQSPCDLFTIDRQQLFALGDINSLVFFSLSFHLVP